MDRGPSRWIGAGSYWLDGFITPLAWLLDDEDMKNRGKTLY